MDSENEKQKCLYIKIRPSRLVLSQKDEQKLAFVPYATPLTIIE